MDENDEFDELEGGELDDSYDYGDGRNESPAFQRRNFNQPSNQGNANVPSGLARRGLSQNKPAKGSKVPEKLTNSGLNGANKKDEGLANKLKRKPLASRLGLSRKKSDDNSSNENDNNNADDTSNNNENDNSKETRIEDVVAKVRRIKKIVTISIIAIAVLLVVMFFLMIAGVISPVLTIANSFANINSSNPIDSLDPNADYYEEAVKYYENLQKASDKYVDSCGIYLDRNYIHAALTYKNVGFIDWENIVTEKYVFEQMNKYVDDVANLMVQDCIVDYEVNGQFFNKMKDSNFLKEYYAKPLETVDAQTLTEDIFKFALEGANLAQLASSWYITDNLKVTMGTCQVPYTKNLLNEGSQYSSTIGLSDYVMGAIYGEMDGAISAENKEFLKAFTIVTTSYALGRAGYSPGDTEIWVHNGNCWQLSCDVKEGCTYSKNLGKYGTTYTGLVSKSNTVFQKKPLSQERIQILQEVFDEVFGTVMLTNSGDIKKASHYSDNYLNGKYCTSDCMGQNNGLRDSKAGMDYISILNKYYENFTLKNIKEDLYAENMTYSPGGVNGDVVFYKQTDYKNRFCGRSSATISSSGCGVTSMAMILSTFVNKNITPVVTMNEAYKMGYCGAGISGTSPSYFKKAAAKYNLGYQSVGKSGNLQAVTNALASGNSLVIAHMGRGTFTRGGHYIVLTKVNEKGQVYVLDPNRGRRNGWHNFNSVVVKELKGSFHIITKR